MNDILAKILAIKTEEVATARQMRSEAELLREAQARQDVRGFAQAIEDKTWCGMLVGIDRCAVLPGIARSLASSPRRLLFTGVEQRLHDRSISDR